PIYRASASATHSTRTLSASTHRPPPHPPSFPTRRSSDLRGSLDTKDSAIGNRAGSRHSSAASFREGPAFSIAHAHFVGSRHGNRDRKSTRLNSSHGSISYAVFCLKKKINYKACSKVL